MKKLNIFYWIFTSLLVPALGIGSVYGILSHPASLEQFVKLGYPEYLAPFLGVARLLALFAIIYPKHNYQRLREWAYAGLMFDVTGALYSQLAAHQPVTSIFFPLLTILLLCGSYALFHKRTHTRLPADHQDALSQKLNLVKKG